MNVNSNCVSDFRFFYFVKRKNTKHLTKWVSATFGILTPRSTAKALAPAERAGKEGFPEFQPLLHTVSGFSQIYDR